VGNAGRAAGGETPAPRETRGRRERTSRGSLVARYTGVRVRAPARSRFSVGDDKLSFLGYLSRRGVVAAARVEQALGQV
jgi:hypothetical protein